MENQPSFIEFAAIQIFAAMAGTIRCESSWEEDAREAWRLAKMLHNENPHTEKTFTVYVDSRNNRAAYKDGEFFDMFSTTEAEINYWQTYYVNHRVKVNYEYLDFPVGSWPDYSVKLKTKELDEPA